MLGGWMRTIGFANFLKIYTPILVPSSILPWGSYQVSAFFTVCQLVPLVRQPIFLPKRTRNGELLKGVVALVNHYFSRRFGAKRTLQAGYLLTVANAALCLLLKPLLGSAVLIPFLFFEGCAVSSWMRELDGERACGPRVLSAFASIYTVLMGEIVDEDVALHARPAPVSTLIFTLNGAVVRGSIGLAPILVTSVLDAAGLPDFLAALNDHPAEARPSPALQVPTPTPSHRPSAGKVSWEQEAAFLVATLYPAVLGLLALALLNPYALPLRARDPADPRIVRISESDYAPVEA